MRATNSWIFRAFLALTASGLVACAGPRESYVVLPDASGEGGSLSVKAHDGSQLQLTGAYAKATGRGGQVLAADRMNAQAVEAKFGAALSARPLAPQRFTLYFNEGSDELTAASKEELAGVMAEVHKRPAPDVIVVGHTDRVGALLDNDRLALRRAEKVRQLLIAEQLPADSIQVAGRGEREPLKVTADEVAEAKNRRVELIVR